jgi:hypothetical protein
MKNQKDAPITAPLLQDLMEREQVRLANLAPMFVNQPLKPADLAHDSGERYNNGFIFPQE